MAYVLFISEAKLKDSTAINLNVDVDLLLPYVRQAQKLYVESKLGEGSTFYFTLPKSKKEVRNGKLEANITC